MFKRPTDLRTTTANNKSSLYFTSGTTGMLKMIYHDFAYPLGHILTARFLQNLDDSSSHLTVANMGWAKASWGKLYGQWLCDSCVFIYDYERFEPYDLMEKITRYGVTSFCALPTIYRHIIKENFSKYDLSKLKEVFYRFKEMTVLEIKEGFGQTETVILAAIFSWMKVKQNQDLLVNHRQVEI
ncbi:MAG: AMP-binding protein [Endomicrobium sp.]|nr:AMP-binding protein [Endomicrobium sp.]